MRLATKLVRHPRGVAMLLKLRKLLFKPRADVDPPKGRAGDADLSDGYIRFPGGVSDSLARAYANERVVAGRAEIVSLRVAIACLCRRFTTEQLNRPVSGVEISVYWRPDEPEPGAQVTPLRVVENALSGHVCQPYVSPLNCDHEWVGDALGLNVSCRKCRSPRPGPQ